MPTSAPGGWELPVLPRSKKIQTLSLVKEVVPEEEHSKLGKIIDKVGTPNPTP